MFFTEVYVNLDTLNDRFQKQKNDKGETKSYSAYPFQETDPAKKDWQWALNIHQYAYYSWLKGTTVIPYSKRTDFYTYRLYSEDRQDTQKYKERLARGKGKNKTDERKGYLNISWDNHPVLSKFKRIYMAMMNEMEHDLAVYCTDPASTEERTKKKWEIKTNTLLNPFFKQLGLPTKENDLPVQPKNDMELDMLLEAPFNLTRELAYQRCMEDSFYISNWDEIKDEIYEDFFDLGIAGVKSYVEAGKVKGRYCDPINTIILETNRRTFELSPLTGEIKAYKLSELRPKIQATLRARGLSDKEIDEKINSIAQTYSNIFGNSIYTNQVYYNSNSYYNQYGFYPYDNFIVWVMEQEWNSTDRWEGTDVNVMYSSSWIIATDIVFDFGYANDVPRDSSSAMKFKDVAKGSFHFYKVADKSITADCISPVDMVNLSIRKIRNEVATKGGMRLFVDTGVVKNINLGDGELKPLDIMRIGTDTGIFYYQSTTHHGQVLSPTASQPIRSDEGGIGRYLQELIQLIDVSLNTIREAIGMNPATDASTPSPKLLVGVADHLSAATNRALQPLYKGYINIKQQFGKNLILRLQARKIFGGLDYYKNVLGEYLYEAMMVDSAFESSEAKFLILPRPTDEDKKQIQEALGAAVKTPLAEGGVTISTYFRVNQLISRGNFYGMKMAELLLTHEVDESIQRSAQEKQTLIEQQGNKNIELQQTVAQQAAELEKSKLNSGMSLQNNQATIDMGRDSKLHEYKMQELALQHNIVKEGKDNQTAGMLEVEKMKTIAKLISDHLKSESDAKKIASSNSPTK